MNEDKQIPIYHGTQGVVQAQGFTIHMLESETSRYEDIVHPHRHDYYTLIVLKEGQTKQFIDFKAFYAEQPAIFLMRPGQVHMEVDSSKAHLYVINFTSDFLSSHTVNNEWQEQFYTSLLIPNAEEVRLTLPLLDLLLQEYQYYEKNRAILRFLLLALLKKIEQWSAKIAANVSQKRYFTLMRKFISAVEENFLTKTQVNDYADLLCVSAGHLNEVIKVTIGNNVKAVIDERRALEAKRLLYWTELPIKEVARKLGFEDQPYFTKFFKKMTGELPASFQKKIHKSTHHYL